MLKKIFVLNFLKVNLRSNKYKIVFKNFQNLYFFDFLFNFDKK